MKKALLGATVMLGLISGSADALTVTGAGDGSNVGSLDLGLNTVAGTDSGSCSNPVEGQSFVLCDNNYRNFLVDLPTGLKLNSIVAEIVSLGGPISGVSFSSTDGSIWGSNLAGVSTTGNILIGALLGPYNLGSYLINATSGTETGPFTYDWKLSFTTEAVSDVPLPAALPLFAAGLSAMGFMGWRRRKAAGAG